MFEIKWIITDNLKNIDLLEFDKKCNGIYGYFEMNINERKLGFCPSRRLFDGEEGNENILYWLSELDQAVDVLLQNKDFELQLLSLNLVKLTFCKNKSDVLVINLSNSETNNIIWSEKVLLEEFSNIVEKNLLIFGKNVRDQNSTLLKSKFFKPIAQKFN